MVLIETHVELTRDFMVTGVAALAVFDLAHGIGVFARLAMDRARRPVVAVYFIEHGATDADAGVGLEAGPLAGIVIACGFLFVVLVGLFLFVGLLVRRLL